MPTVRPATPSDAETIASFNEANGGRDRGKTLDPGTIRAGVKALFARPELGFYLIAEEEERAVAS